MARKMTDDEKEAARVDRNARRRAFDARKREKYAREEVLKAAVEAEHGPAIDDMESRWDGLMDERKQVAQWSKEEFAKLQAEVARKLAGIEARFDPVKDERTRLYDAKRAAEHKVQQQLNSEFPDLADLWVTASTWKRAA